MANFYLFLLVFIFFCSVEAHSGGLNKLSVRDSIPNGPTKKNGFTGTRDSVLSARLLFILNNQQTENNQAKPRLLVSNFQFQIPLPAFLQTKKQGTSQYQYKFEPVFGKVNLKFFIFSNQVSSFTLGVDSQLYRHSRLFSNNLVTRLVKVESNNQNEIYFRYQINKFALISSWEFSSFRNKFDEGARWNEDKIKIVISYLF